MAPFILVLLGLLLILIEFYIPGMVMGILGTIAIIAGLVLFASASSSWIAVLLFVVGTLISVVILIRFALWRIVHAKPGYSIYSDHDQEGYYASSFDQLAIGKEGIVLTDLKPGGFIQIEGKKHAAISSSGYISKGESVVVISGQEQSLIVRRNEHHA